MAAAAFGLATALCWGFADFLGGLRTRTSTLAFVLLVSQLSGTLAIVIVIAAGSFEAPTVGELLPAAAAGASQIIGIAALYRALASGTMSVISPVSAGGAAVLPVIVGVATGERPESLQYAGMAAALIGVIMATRATSNGGAGTPSSALWLAGLSAIGIGGFYVGMDAAVADAGPFWALLAARVTAFAMLGAALIAIRPALGATRDPVPTLALIGLLDVAANACFTIGTDTGLLSVVAVLASLYPVATVVLARAVLNERLVAVQAAGVAVTLVGVALIASG